LGVVRSVVEGDPVFLSRLALAATSELLDDVGMLWITRPDGWERRIGDLLDAAATDAAEEGTVSAGAALRKEQRRREAAESAATRARAELADERSASERAIAEAAGRETALTAEVTALRVEANTLRERVRSLEAQLRRAARGAVADSERAGDATASLEMLRVRLAEAESARDRALADRVNPAGPLDLERLRVALLGALAILTDGESPDGGGAARSGSGRRATRTTRRPIALPGGLLADSEAGAEHLLRAAGVVVVDGYNVAKLGWPGRALDQQREACIAAAERLAVRWGTLIHVIFDGSTVVGAHTGARRAVRVSYSPEGVSADDIIRAEVASLPDERSVVVVTNDRAVAVDVRTEGANVLSSDAFLAVAGR
jgi:predicted RNA-binding protein with PIN domain